MILAMVSRDIIILGGMLGASIAGVMLAIMGRVLMARIGAMISIVPICLGLANFGWLPLFGGTHDPSTYFGCEMLFGGILSMVVFWAIDQRHPKKSARGFPVDPVADPFARK
jgi:hypothetical protein